MAEWGKDPVARPWEKDLAIDDVATLPKRGMTLTERAGLDPNAERLNVLPYPRGVLTGQGGVKDKVNIFGVEIPTDWVAPQWLADMKRSFVLPEHVKQGGAFTPEDALKFTLDYAAPLTARGKIPSKIKQAPSTNELKKLSRSQFGMAKGTGVTLKPDSYIDVLSRIETKLGQEGFDAGLHPKLNTAMSALAKKIGNPSDIKGLQNARRQLGIAARSVEPDERRIADIAINTFDDFIDNLKPSDLISGAGNEKKAAAALKMARNAWWRAVKSEKVEKIISDAEIAGTGMENGLVQGFRSLLKNSKEIRRFTADEVKAMRQLVNRRLTAKGLRLLGRLSFGTKGGSNFLGGSIGVAGGSAVGSAIGGPVGAAVGGVAAPAVGYLAAKGSDKLTLNAARQIRALAAVGGVRPSVAQSVFKDLMAPSMIGAGTQIPTITPEQARDML